MNWSLPNQALYRRRPFGPRQPGGLVSEFLTLEAPVESLE